MKDPNGLSNVRLASFIEAIFSDGAKVGHPLMWQTDESAHSVKISIHQRERQEPNHNLGSCME